MTPLNRFERTAMIWMCGDDEQPQAIVNSGLGSLRRKGLVRTEYLPETGTWHWILTAAGQEAMRTECDRVALAHKSKIEVNEWLWHEGQDWAVIRISNAIRALPIDPPCKPEEEK